MKKAILILMAFLPLVLTAQVEQEKIDLSTLMKQFSSDSYYSAFEVEEEMFKAFCELEQADSMAIAIFQKIKSVKMAEVQTTSEPKKKRENSTIRDTDFYDTVVDNLDLSGYNQLLKSSNNNSIALLLKKEHGPADNEFLLITEKMLIDIRGDIKITTIYEMEEMMQYVQQILPN